MNLNFGCGMYVYEDNQEMNQMQMLLEVFKALSTDPSDPAWKNQKSFFVSMSGLLEMDFSKNAKKINVPDLGPLNFLVPQDGIDMVEGMPLIYGKILKFTPSFEEVTVMDGDDEKQDEGRYLLDRLKNLENIKEKNQGMKMVSDLLFSSGIPLVPFPDVAPCLGLEPKDSSMVIKEGYAVMSYDYDVYKSGENCLFDIKRGIQSKEARIAQKIAK